MKKRWLLYVTFGFIFYLIFLIIQMPASWFAWALNYYSHNAIRLDPITGNLWGGTGKLVYYNPPNTPHDLGNAKWSINPFWLFAGRLQTTWQSNPQGALLNITLRLSPGKIELLDTEIAFPAQSTSTFYPPASLITPQGQVRLHSEKLSIANNEMTGTANIEWQAAESSLTPVQPLGDYRLEIIGLGKTANLKLSTLRGALELNGQGQWQFATGKISINGTANPRERADELEPLLRFLGEDQGGGKRSLTIDTSLPLARLSP